MEVHAVNLALNANVLAVCAVVVFVGAVLLGAF
jgi:NADH:ubiquinone oxidoreductase subunit 6 (subunit J)